MLRATSGPQDCRRERERERDSGRPSENLRENRVFYTLIEKNWKDRFSQNFVGF